MTITTRSTTTMYWFASTCPIRPRIPTRARSRAVSLAAQFRAPHTHPRFLLVPPKRPPFHPAQRVHRWSARESASWPIQAWSRPQPQAPVLAPISMTTGTTCRLAAALRPGPLSRRIADPIHCLLRHPRPPAAAPTMSRTFARTSAARPNSAFGSSRPVREDWAPAAPLFQSSKEIRPAAKLRGPTIPAPPTGARLIPSPWERGPSIASRLAPLLCLTAPSWTTCALSCQLTAKFKRRGSTMPRSPSFARPPLQPGHRRILRVSLIRRPPPIHRRPRSRQR
jgi:hypothetical protein